MQRAQGENKPIIRRQNEQSGVFVWYSPEVIMKMSGYRNTSDSESWQVITLRPSVIDQPVEAWGHKWTADCRSKNHCSLLLWKSEKLGKNHCISLTPFALFLKFHSCKCQLWTRQPLFFPTNSQVSFIFLIILKQYLSTHQRGYFPGLCQGLPCLRGYDTVRTISMVKNNFKALTENHDKSCQ